MADQQIVDSIRVYVEAALARGFKVIACLPHDVCDSAGKYGKAPYTKYSPHACNSATSDPKIALRPWLDGEEANYGVSCGLSGITVIDCDHGIHSTEEFEAWKKTHNLPDTYTVLSGRDGDELGFHLYYTGVIPTTDFNFGGVSGELKSAGGYVVGAGSIHTSGKRYTEYSNIDLQPLPEGIKLLAKNKPSIDFKPKAEGGELIPAGSRWIHLQSMTGKFRNAGLDRDGIYAALKNFLKNQCEDGENYPDDKVQAMADAGAHVFDAAESTPVVFVGGNETVDDGVPLPNISTSEGNWLGDITKSLTEGTIIPPVFVYATLKTIIGASFDGMVGFPGQEDLHTRTWMMLISPHPESGKDESMTRVKMWAIPHFIKTCGLVFPEAGLISSGEHMIKVLAAYENMRTLVYFSEMKLFFDKTGDHSTLLSKMTELFEQKAGSAGSLSNDATSFKNVGVNFIGNFTESSFEAALAGKGGGGDGFLSRSILEHSDSVPVIGEWPPVSGIALKIIADQILNRWETIHVATDPQNPAYTEPRFVPKITDDAKAAMLDFEDWCMKKKFSEKDDFISHTSRLIPHFKRDVLIRCIMSDDCSTITQDMVNRSVLWAKRQFELRSILWPVDKGNPTERMEQGIRRALKNHKYLTKRQINKLCHVGRSGSGGAVSFNQAWTAMLRDEIGVLGKSGKKELFRLIADD